VGETTLRAPIEKWMYVAACPVVPWSVGPVPTYGAAVRLNLCATLTLTITLTFDLLSWKLAYRLHTPWGTFAPIMVSASFCFRVRSRYGTNRRTDGRATYVLRPIRTAARIMNNCRPQDRHDVRWTTGATRVLGPILNGWSYTQTNKFVDCKIWRAVYCGWWSSNVHWG